MNGEYELIQFHFHWGSKRGQGAEHLIGGESSDAELHFVHAKKSNDPDYDPLQHSDGLAVLGVRLVEMDWRENTTFKPLTDHFKTLIEIGKHYPCTGKLIYRSYAIWYESYRMTHTRNAFKVLIHPLQNENFKF